MIKKIKYINYKFFIESYQSFLRFSVESMSSALLCPHQYWTVTFLVSQFMPDSCGSGSSSIQNVEASTVMAEMLGSNTWFSTSSTNSLDRTGNIVSSSLRGSQSDSDCIQVKKNKINYFGLFPNF